MANYSVCAGLVTLTATRAFLFGGCDAVSVTRATNMAYVYDFSNNVWSRKGNMIKGRCHHGGGMIWLNGELVDFLLINVPIHHVPIRSLNMHLSATN
jgi:hypothetical protein